MQIMKPGLFFAMIMLGWVASVGAEQAALPLVAPGAWKGSLNEHPRLYGTRAALKALAPEKAGPYKSLRTQPQLAFAVLVHAVEGLPAEKVKPFIDEAMKLVAKGPTNVHQDSWVWLDTVCLTYDGFHDLISPGDRAKMLEWMNAHLKSFTQDEGAFHNSTLPKIRTYLRIAYATWNENPQAKEFRDYALLKLFEGRVLPVLNKFGAGGGTTEGGWYGRLSLWALVEGLELARRFEGYDGFARAKSFFYQRMAYELHESFPGLWLYGSERYAMEGDGAMTYGGILEYPRHARTILAQYFRGSELSRFVSAKRRKPSNPVALLVDFLYEEKPDAPADLKDLPLAHLASGVGRLYARSDWSADATWFRFEAGPYFTGHQHFDAGNFEIVRHEPLATEGGEYDDYLTSHAVNYYTRTIAHNCVLVLMPGEQWKNLRIQGPYGNDGGQAKKWAWGWQTLEQWEKEWPAQDRGRITAYDNQPDCLYVAADLTAAYAKEKLSLWTRQVVFLRPHTFVILDRVHSTRAEYPKTWLLQAKNAPKIQGRTTLLENGKGRLWVQTLLPADAKLGVVEGYTYDGQTYPPRSKVRSAEAAKFRLEVTPTTAAREDLFLHVLSTEGLPKAQVVQNGKVVRVTVEDQTLEFDEVMRLTGPGGTRVFKDVLKPGRWETQ